MILRRGVIAVCPNSRLKDSGPGADTAPGRTLDQMRFSSGVNVSHLFLLRLPIKPEVVRENNWTKVSTTLWYAGVCVLDKRPATSSFVPVGTRAIGGNEPTLFL